MPLSRKVMQRIAALENMSNFDKKWLVILFALMLPKTILYPFFVDTSYTGSNRRVFK